MSSIREAGGREYERELALFGSEVRVLVGAPLRAGLPCPELAALAVESLLRHHHRALTRFDSGSELSRLNRDERERVPVSGTVARALGAALWAAERSGGLVDPTLVGELERAGYAASRVGIEPASLREALLAAPARRPARAREDAAWRRIQLADGDVRRPPGARLDLGGTAKSVAADEAAVRLGDYSSFVIDAGGDIVIGGAAAAPRLVEIAHPLAPEPALRFHLTAGAIATSGLATRVWRTGDSFAHHLIDPSTGRPAWTGVVQASAIAGTGLKAETLAKAAVLSGPRAGRRLLERHGGVLVLDGGEVLAAGALRERVETAA